MKISDELRKWCDGADVDGNACDDLRVLADRIDAERALPDGVEWPRFEDGEPVRFGDEVDWDGDVMRVGSVWLHREGWGLHVSSTGVEGTFHGEYCKRVKRPAPKVLDADGVPIKVGDTVYCDDDPEQLIVDSFDDTGCVYITLAKSPDGILYTIEPSRLSHDEPPDSLERIADELEAAGKWCDQNGDYDTGVVSISEEKFREWSDRIRKLAKEG